MPEQSYLSPWIFLSGPAYEDSIPQALSMYMVATGLGEMRLARWNGCSNSKICQDHSPNLLMAILCKALI